jgi:hypothetical protein
MISTQAKERRRAEVDAAIEMVRGGSEVLKFKPTAGHKRVVAGKYRH